MATLGVGLAGIRKCGDAIRTEMAEGAAQFAPGGEGAGDRVEERHRERPDDSRRRLTPGIDIGHAEFAFIANRMAQQRQPRLGRLVLVPDRHEQPTGIDGDPHRFWQGGADTGKGGGGRLREFRVGLRLHPTRAQHQGFQLVGAKHQWWQQEAGFESITDAGVTFDIRALCTQAGDIAIERTQADCVPGCQIRRRDRTACASQVIDEGKEASGAV